MIRDSISYFADARTTQPLLLLLASLIVSSCALPSVVQRQTVEYNTAAAAMANQLALMNIIRAEQHLPIFYTSISRLSGSTVVTASGGFNAAIKTASPVETESLTNAPATTVGSATSVTTTVTNLASRAVTSGGTVYTPSIGGQVVSGPSFDINILDTQQFYQGILAEIPFSTIELFINQGFDNQLIMRLLVERIEYRKTADGTLDHTIYNAPDGPEALAFLQGIACLKLTGDSPKKVSPIAPISRLVNGTQDEKKGLSLKDLAILDGKQFDLAEKVGNEFKSGTAFISSTPDTDADIYVVRPPADKRLPHLEPLGTCVVPKPLEAGGSPGAGINSAEPLIKLLPKITPHNLRSAGIFAFDSAPDEHLDAIIYFRSPEGLIRFLGNYLAKFKAAPTRVFAFESGPLFSVIQGHASAALVSTEVSGETYSIPKHDNAETNMSVLALVEELVNLQKSATDRPVTVPVHVLQ